MIELQEIKNRTTWNDAASAINNNNAAIQIAIAKLQSKQGGEKGYFPSIDALQQALPVAVNGDIAYVGSDYPYEIYQYSEENGWTSTGLFGGIKGLGATQVKIGNQTFDAKDGVVEINSFSHVTRGISPVSGEEIDLGSQGNSFNQIYASEFIEGSKSLSERYLSKDAAQATFATKEEASSFVNVGRQSNLQSAIAAIPYRVGLQVVTFTNESTLKRKKVFIRFSGLIDNESKAQLTINGVSSAAITCIGGDEATRNHSIHEGFVNDPNIVPFIFKSYCSDTAMVLELNEYAGDAQVSVIQTSPATSELRVTQAYKPIKNESYQLKENTTEDSVFLDTANWEVYSTDSGDSWQTW